MNNRQKVFNNIKSNLLYQAITLVLGIMIPRLVLVNLGSEANGLLNSTNQAITYLALLESGMGLSITQALYGPVARDERNIINGIMSASNYFYRNVGKLYFVGMIVIAIVYTVTIPTSLSKFTVFGVVMLTGLPQVVNFFFQGKYRTLISISGKGYVLTNFNTITYIGTSVIKIVLLINGFGVIAIQLLYFTVSLTQMFFIIWYVKKEFPWLDINVSPMTEKIGRRDSVFLHQISGFIFSNTDLLILTYLCDLKVVSVYSMYNIFYTMVNSLISNITGSIVFLMGQTFNSDKKKYLELHNVCETLSMMLTFSCYSVMNICILPFLQLYVGDITDINYIDDKLPILFTAIQLLISGRFASQKVIEYAGKFKETQIHATIEMLINIVCSIVFTLKYGIYGVLAGTVAALVVRSVLMISYASKEILHNSQGRVYMKWGVNTSLFCVLYMCGSKMSIILDSYFDLILFAGLAMSVVLLIYMAAVYLYDKKTFKFAICKVKGFKNYEKNNRKNC